MKAGSPFELTVPEAVARIRARNPILHAFVSTSLDEALLEARARADERPRSLLHGVPYSLKDQWDTAGIPTTGGSYRYKDRVPRVSSPVHLAFEAAGAVLLGKTNLSDLAMVSESASYVGGVARNPHDLARTPGGSSGGAAAAVVDGMSAFDWGADVGVAGAKWTFLVYRSVKPSAMVHYDARKFFQDAIDRGLIQPTDFIATLELGNEITSGTGVTWIKNFKVEIQ